MRLYHSSVKVSVDSKNKHFYSTDNCLVETVNKKLLVSGNGVIADGIKIIGKGVFQDCTFTAITLPQTVEVIEEGAFACCENLTKITIPDSVTSIADYVFYGCTSLKIINFTGTEEKWNEISKGTDWDSNTGDYTIVYNYIDA